MIEGACCGNSFPRNIKAKDPEMNRTDISGSQM